MGGQACVLYGAAEYSRDLDLAVLATDSALPKLRAALHALSATVIAVPPFEMQFLMRGHAVHFNVPGTERQALRVDIMSRMRGVAAFEELWERRTTVMLPNDDRSTEVEVDVMALEDLVAAKKTQRDKDWPMLRRLVDASYDSARESVPSRAQIEFWLAELRTPEFLREAVMRFPEAAQRCSRDAVQICLTSGDIDVALAAEQAREMSADKQYWGP